MKSNKFNIRKALLIVVSSLVVVALCVGLLFFALKDDSSSQGKEDPNITVGSPEEAAAQLKELGDDFGYENALSELTEKSTTTIDGDTYYRLQQNYQGIPVYSRTVVYVTDENGKAIAITGNVIDVGEKIDAVPTASMEQLTIKIATYAVDEIGFAADACATSILSQELVWYVDSSGHTALAYCVLAYIGEDPYEVVVDANTGEVYVATCQVTTESVSVNMSVNDYEHEVNLWQEDDGSYITYDAENNIRVLSANGETLIKYVIVEDSTGAKYIYDPVAELWFDEHLVVSAAPTSFNFVDFGFKTKEAISGVTQPIFTSLEALDQDACRMLFFVTVANDFFSEALFREGWGNGATETLEVVFDCANGSYHYSPVRGVSMLSIESEDSLNTVTHELTHAMERSESRMTYSGESGAIMEALSDIFAEIVEYDLLGACDWLYDSGLRNLIDPSLSTESNMAHPSMYKGKNWYSGSQDNGGVHINSTVISHAAYLMSVDSGGLLTMDELAKLWYRAMLMMPSDCDFAQCRTLVELAGESMDLSDNKIQCISAAFDNVGILGSNTVDYTIDKNVEMNVYGVDSQLHDNYTICITGRQLCIENIDKLDKKSIGIPLDFEYLSMILTKEYSNAIEINTAQPANLHLPFGVYTITLYDNTDNSKTYSFRVSVEGSGNKDKLDIYTNFSGNDKDETDIEQIPEVDPATIDGAVHFNGHYYKVYNGQSSWEAAAVFCQSMGGHLATITSEEENTFLHDYLVSLGLSGAYFGFSDINIEGNWVWCTGEEVTFTNWDSGEPNNEGRKEHYGLFDFSHNDGKWNDGSYRSGTNTNFICEWDAAVPPDTGNNGSTKTVYLLKQSVTYSADYDDQPSKTKNYRYNQDSQLTGVSIETVSKRIKNGKTSYKEQLLEYRLECDDAGHYSAFSALLDGSGSARGTITCDANGRIVEFYSSETGQKYFFTYNSEGLICEYVYEYSGETYSHSKMQYDSRGNIVFAENTQRDGKKTESRTEIEYDVGDCLVMMKQYTDGIEQNAILQRCDAHGNVMVEEHYRDGEMIGWIEYTYETRTVPDSWEKVPDVILTLLGG